MKYTGKEYFVVLTLDGQTWKWSVHLEGRKRSGKVLSRLEGIKLAEAEIDRALAPKKKRPSSRVPRSPFG